MIKTRASVNDVIYDGAEMTVSVQNTSQSSDSYDLAIYPDSKYTGTVRNIARTYLADVHPELKLIAAPKEARFYFKLGLDNEVDKKAVKSIVKSINGSYIWYPKTNAVSLVDSSSTNAERNLGITIANTKYDFTKNVNLGENLAEYKNKKPISFGKYLEESDDEHGRYIIRTQPQYISLAVESLDTALAGLKNLFGKIADESQPVPSRKSVDDVNKMLALAAWAIFRAKRLESQINTVAGTDDISPDIKKKLLNFKTTHLTTDDLDEQLQAMHLYGNTPETEKEIGYDELTKPLTVDEENELYSLFKKRNELDEELTKRYKSLLFRFKKSKIPFATELPKNMYGIFTPFLKDRGVDPTGAMILPTGTKQAMKNIMTPLSAGQSDARKQEVESIKTDIDKFKEQSSHSEKDIKDAVFSIKTGAGSSAADAALYAQKIFQNLKEIDAQSYSEDVDSGSRAKFMVVNLAEINDARELKSQLEDYTGILNTIEQQKKAVENDPDLEAVLKNPKAPIASAAVKEYLHLLKTLGAGETPKRVEDNLEKWKEYLAIQWGRLNTSYPTQKENKEKESKLVLTHTADDLEAEYPDDELLADFLDSDVSDLKNDPDKNKYIDAAKMVDSEIEKMHKIPSPNSQEEEILAAYNSLPTQKAKNDFLKYFSFRKIIFDKLKALGASVGVQTLEELKYDYNNLMVDGDAYLQANEATPDLRKQIGVWISDAGKLENTLKETAKYSLDKEQSKRLLSMRYNLINMGDQLGDKDYNIELALQKNNENKSEQSDETSPRETNSDITQEDLNQGYEDKIDFGELNKQQDN